MKNIKLTLAIFFGGIFALWLLATPFPEKLGVYPLRGLLLQFTGTISILAMSACLILAVQPQNTGNPARRTGQNVPPAQMVRHHRPFRQHPALDQQAIPKMAGKARTV